MTAAHPEPELLALAALPAERPDPGVAAHLEGCATCRTRVGELRRTVELARENGVGESLPVPPPRVWRAIVDELALDEPAGDEGNGAVRDVPPAVVDLARARPAGRRQLEPAPAPEPAPDTAPPGRRARFARRRALVGAAAAAAVIGLGAGLGIGLNVAGGGAPTPAPVPVVRLAPVGFTDPGATGTAAMVDRDGDRRMVVELTGVTDLAGGDYLEAWLMDSSGSRLLPLGALARHGEEFRGDFIVPAGLPVDEYNRVDVSAERFDGDPGHSQVSLLRGDLA